MKTIKEMALQRYFELQSDTASIDEQYALGFLLGYSDCAYGLLIALKKLIEDGDCTMEFMRFYIDKKLREFQPSEGEDVNSETKIVQLNK